MRMYLIRFQGFVGDFEASLLRPFLSGNIDRISNIWSDVCIFASANYRRNSGIAYVRKHNVLLQVFNMSKVHITKQNGLIPFLNILIAKRKTKR